jgi:hypothetical protein
MKPPALGCHLQRKCPGEEGVRIKFFGRTVQYYVGSIFAFVITGPWWSEAEKEVKYTVVFFRVQARKQRDPRL